MNKSQKFLPQKFIHLSTQNLNFGLEFKTGQNHPVNKTKKNTGELYVFVCDTTKNLEKSSKFSSQKFIHISTQNLKLGLKFKTGQTDKVILETGLKESGITVIAKSLQNLCEMV